MTVVVHAVLVEAAPLPVQVALKGAFAIEGMTKAHNKGIAMDRPPKTLG